MIDTHAHLDTEKFDDDREQVIRKAFDSGVEKIIIPAIEPGNFSKIIDLCEKYDQIYCGMGIHPHESNETNEDTLEQIEKYFEHNKVVAVGETGLDYYYDFNPRETQINSFRKHIRLAKKHNLPLIVHNRESDEDLISILEEEQDGSLKGVLHCFSSDEEFLEKAIKLGFMVSFTGNITFKNSTLDSVIKKSPIDRIMLETDSPYMTPVPNRGKRNDPSHIKYVAEKISQLKDISVPEVISMTTKNAIRLFNLSTFLLLFIFSFSFLTAQDNSGNDENYQDDFLESQLEEDYENPYQKFIGFAPVIGFNTIVETQYLKAGEKDISYEGIIAYGGSLLYSPVDYLITEVTYLYSKNTKVSDQWKGLVKPSIYQVVELSLHWISNPYGRINIYAITGGAVFFNDIGGAENTIISSTNYGLNVGIGFYGNIETSWGLFVPSLEWKIDFSLNRGQGNNIARNPDNPDEPIITPVETHTFFSIPRLSFIFFPKF